MSALETGQQVDRYRLERTIHRGHGTVVFAATDVTSGRSVAFKVLADRYATDPAVRQRFLDEAATASRLGPHPNIAAVLAWGQVGDAMYFVTELVAGVSLADLLAEAGGRGLPAAEALELLDQVASALDFAHQHGVVHRDVRPASVMVALAEGPRRACLVDFGITKTTDRMRPGVTGVFIGTADYAAPEQIAGTGRIDGRADVYALACVAAELLTGRPPYGDAANDAARIAAHLQAPVPRLSSRRADLPPAIDEVFARALAKQPGTRPGRAGELVRELRVALLSPAPASAGTPRPLLPARPGPTRSRRGRVIAAAAAVVVLGVALTVASLARRGGPSAEVATATTRPAPTAPPRTAAASTIAPTTPPTTTSPPTTVAVGPFGYSIGAAVTTASGPAAAFALGVQQRDDPRAHAAAGSPALWYGQWLRATSPPPTGPVTATGSGFAVTADRPVELRDFRVEGGVVTSFSECAAAGCVSLEAAVTAPADPDCRPAPGCPNLRSQSGDVTAYQRATLLVRWPAHILVYELVVDPGLGRAVTTVEEPNAAVHYDTTTGYMVITFAERPEAGTRHHLTITFDDATTDSMTIYYG